LGLGSLEKWFRAHLRQGRRTLLVSEPERRCVGRLVHFLQPGYRHGAGGGTWFSFGIMPAHLQHLAGWLLRELKRHVLSIILAWVEDVLTPGHGQQLCPLGQNELLIAGGARHDQIAALVPPTRLLAKDVMLRPQQPARRLRWRGGSLNLQLPG